MPQTKDDTVMMIEGGTQAAAIEERCDQVSAPPRAPFDAAYACQCVAYMQTAGICNKFAGF